MMSALEWPNILHCTWGGITKCPSEVKHGHSPSCNSRQTSLSREMKRRDDCVVRCDRGMQVHCAGLGNINHVSGEKGNPCGAEIMLCHTLKEKW